MPAAEYPFALLDIPSEGRLTPDSDCRVVDDALGDDLDALGVAIDHMIRSEQLGRPADPVR